MMRTVLVLLIVLGSGHAHAQGPGGYQLKYKPIPPKSKKEEPKPTPTDEDQALIKRITRLPLSGNSTVLTPEERQQRADWSARQKKFAAEDREARKQQINDFKTQRAAADQAAYDAEVKRQGELADIYDKASVKAQAQAEAQWEVNRRSLILDAQLRAMEPQQPSIYITPVAPRYPAEPGHGREALRQGYYDGYYNSLYWDGYGGW